MKRLLALALIGVMMLVAVFPMTGCGGVDEVAVIARAKELIPKTALINQLFHIEGLPLKTGGKETGGYAEADMAAIRQMGYDTLEDIIADMSSVWTQGYITRFRESSLFASVNIGTSHESKYCYDQYHITTDAYEGIWVSVDGLPNRTDYVEYLYDTLTVKRVQDKNTVRMTMQVVVTDSEDASKTMETELNFTMARENTKSPWLLDSAVAVKYYEDPDGLLD